MIGGAKKCKAIWNAIRKADFRKEGVLNMANLKLVFESCNEKIYELLKIEKVQDFIDLFDADRDGFLNEDEQISIFSLIKEKMQLLCEELSKIHEYQLYKDIMKEVRHLETDIVSYQDELRETIQSRQLKEYVEIGDEKLKDFFNDWKRKFAEFEDQSMGKMEGLKQKTEQEMEELNSRLE